MAGGIISRWKLTLDPAGTPTVLVNVGDRLESEILLDLTRIVSVTPLVRAAAPALRNEGNAAASISFAIYQDASSDATAREDMLIHLLTALSADPKPLRFEVSGVTDKYWQFASALVRSVTPTRYLRGVHSRRLTRYDITAAGFSQVAVP